MKTQWQRIDRLSSAAASRLESFRVLLGLSIVASISMVFSFSILPTAPGLDPSFIYAFNHAAARGWRWGRDFISTYGPYGYLVNAMDAGDLVQRIVAINLLHAIGCGIAAAAYLQSMPRLRPVARLTLTLVLIYALGLQYQEYRWFALFLLVFLTGLHLRERNSLTAYSLASVLAGFCFLIKFSTGIAALMTLVLGCLLVQRPRDAAYRLAVAMPVAIVSFLIGWVAHGGTLAGIGDYVATGWEVSSGYSSAMSLGPDGWQTGAISFLIWFGLVALWVLVQPTARNRLTLVGLAIPLFTAWKHAIVRQDGHVFNLVNFGFFVLAICLAEALVVWRWRSTLPVVGILLVPLVIPWFNAAAGGPNAGGALKEWVSGPLKLHGLRDLVRLGHFASYREDVARVSESLLRKDVLPESIRMLIGGSSVDVYPWEVSYVPANALSWANRPLPASFSSYTPTLDKLNAAFFESGGRPEYLIWHSDVGVESIDGRYLFWDEPRTLRSIVNFYDMLTADSGVIVLRTRAHPRFGPPQPLGTLRVPWNTWTPVPQPPGVLLAEASIERSLIMRVIRTAFREGPVFLSLRFSSGEEARYRVVRDNMAGGLWVSPFVVSVDELRSLFRGDPARRVIAVRFSGRSASRLSRAILVSWYQLTPLDAPVPPVRPSHIPTLGRGTGPCAGSIDSVYRDHDWYGRAAIRASGWARDGNSPIAPKNLWLVDGEGRVLATEVQTGLRRPDVAQAANVPSLEGSGWTASAPTEGGAIEMGFVIRTRRGDLVRSCNKRSEAYGAPGVGTLRGVPASLQAVPQ